MQLLLYQFLSQLNRMVLPQFSRRSDLTQLKKWEQALVGWKMWVTYRYLDTKNQR
ncbi:MAG: SsrA-binding protein [Crocinitomicaceae bacterium]|nr:SsrA-binding protein [Crocinitomicaceae bacterium]